MPLLAFALSAALATPLDPTAVRQALADVPADGSHGADIDLPIGPTERSRFHLVDSRTLPPELMRRYPGLRSFRGNDDQGRTARLDVSSAGTHLSVRDGADTWTLHLPGSPGHAPTIDDRPDAPASPLTASAASRSRRSVGGGSGSLRYDFRLAVAASSRYTEKFGGTVEGGLTAVAHAVNQANDVFENDLGVHFTLAARNDRLILTQARKDPFLRSDPGPAAVELIDRRLGAGAYDIGHALTDMFGGESTSGTSCSDDLSADFHATHKAAAWSGHAHPDTEPYAVGFMIHVLGRQLGAWPTANGCGRFTLDDRAFEPGSGSSAMGAAASGCGGEAQWLQPRSDPYFHAANIAQVRAWLASRGGRCARKRLNTASAPWIDPEALAETMVIPARTPFRLDASVESFEPGTRLTYAWEQMDVGSEQRGPLVDDGHGPLFRSFAPVSSSARLFPRLAAVLGQEPIGPGEALPLTDRWMRFRLTVRDNGGDRSTTASADARVHVVDTGRAFAVTAPAADALATPGGTVRVQWDVAGTTQAPISCHFVTIDLSVDGGLTWPHALASDERNDGETELTIPEDIAATDAARVRVVCDWRPFFAVSPGDFRIARR